MHLKTLIHADVAIILAFIVIDDAVRLRMYLGDQGRYLNMLVKELKVEIDEKQFPRLKERVGHRVSEVIIGGILGFAMTIFLAILELIKICEISIRQHGQFGEIEIMRNTESIKPTGEGNGQGRS